ncbi:MAG TPA: acetyl-CoA carboxylase biotin carboxyl carrier protein [Usitatibacter sp.]|jgi:acetyl-CoA carboxylase biotin carboxyl carrier protein|nr:acetyl-CoA carboxylase biotin carboxyl carrier protein [Usitatibacter sp.]
MSDTKITQKDLDSILKLVESADDISEFYIRHGDLEVRVSRGGGGAGFTPGAQPASPEPARAARPEPPKAAAVPPAAVAPPAIAPGMAVVKSPMVGTFYRASAPGAKPFVEVGQQVKADTVVCIIEVMKLMNSIAAGAAGTVRQILVDDAQPVQFAQALVVIEPSA